MPRTTLSLDDYRVLVDQAPLMIWRSDPDARCDYFNEQWLAFTGRALAQEVGNGWSEGVHPDDLDRCLNIYLTAFARRDSFEMQYRLRRHDGEYRWIFDRGGPILDDHGQFLGYIGGCVDVTERLELQGAQTRALLAHGLMVNDLTRRLLTAEEAVRARIARQLHDDVLKALTSASAAILDLEQWVTHDRDAPSAPAERPANELYADVLHHVGLVRVLEMHCRGIEQQYGLEVTVQSEGDVYDLTTDVALGLFRLAYEALENAATHAAARHLQVTITRLDGHIDLVVADSGIGFDLAEVRYHRRGRGLESMEQRARLMGGHVTVETAPRHGTTVRARIPV